VTGSLEQALGAAPSDPGAAPGRAARGARLALALLFAPLLYRALRSEPDWAAAILASAAVPFVTELGSYYFAYVAAFAFLAERRAEVVPGVTLLALFLAAIGALHGNPDAREVFVWSSACLLVACVALAACFARAPRAGAAA
jgi:hypothetical protein